MNDTTHEVFIDDENADNKPQTDTTPEVEELNAFAEEVEMKEPVKEEVVVKENADAIEEEKIKRPYDLTNPNVVMTVNPRKELPEDDKRDPIGFLGRGSEEMDEITSEPYFEVARDTFPEEYQNALLSGIETSHTSEVFAGALNDPNAKFTQYPKHQENAIKPFVAKWSTGDSNGVLTGVKAISKLRRALKMGSYLSFPCYASGIWITIRTPTVFELADYYELVASETIELGKHTAGAVFNATQVYLVKHFMDLVEKLLYSWTVNDDVSGSKSLREVLVIDDIETIAWALSTSMYPNGYPMEEPCTVDIEKCNHVMHHLLDISKIHWVDQNKLTKWQLEFIAKHDARRSWDDLQKYRSESKWMDVTEVPFADNGFKIILKTPTVKEYIDSGYRWINELADNVREVAMAASDTKINNLVAERAGMSIIRSYAHYVKSIIFDDGTRIVETRDVEDSLNVLCTDEKFITQITNAIKDHITKSTINIVAINRHKCPECQKFLHEESDINPYLVPISALRLFFNLRDRKHRLE